MTDTRRHRAFTLLELILVMVIVCTALAMAAPNLRNWNRGQQQRDAADQIVALTRYARTQAVADANTYRLNVDTQTGRYWLTMQDGQQFINLGAEMGREFQVPDGSRLELMSADGPPTTTVDFYPTGRTQLARLRLTSNTGEVTEIACTAPAEGFVVQTAAQQSQ